MGVPLEVKKVCDVINCPDEPVLEELAIFLGTAGVGLVTFSETAARV